MTAITSLTRTASIPGRLLRRPETALIAAIGAIIRVYYIVYVECPPNVQLDFSSYYVWGALMRQGLNPYRVDVTPYATSMGVVVWPIIRSNYTPFSLLLFESFSLMKPWTAYWVWSLLSLMLLIVAVALLLGTARKMPWPSLVIVATLALLYRPVQIHFEFLQIQILLLFLLTLAYLALRDGNDIAAGGWLAIAGLLKAFPLFMLIYLVCMRKWRALVSAVVVFGSGAGVTFLLIGPRVWSFFAVAVRSGIPRISDPLLPMVSPAGVAERLFLLIADSPMRFFALARRPTQVALEILILVFTLRSALLARNDSRRADYAFGLCTIAMVILLPNAWPHYMVLFLLPLCQLAIAAGEGTAPPRAAALAVVAYILVEASYASAYLGLVQLAPGEHSWVMEGVAVSAVLTFVAAYLLTNNQPSERALTTVHSAAA